MIASSEIIELLGRTTLFASLSRESLAQVASEVHERRFGPGQLIFARGDPGADLYTVREGRVRFSVMSSDGRALAFSHANEGDVFGEIAALDDGLRSADATALTVVRVLVLPRASLKHLIAARPEVAAAAIGFLCQRVRATSENFEAVVLKPIETRVARLLAYSFKLNQQLDGHGLVSLDIGMSQGEIALLIGTSRQSVNAALTALEGKGVIKRSGSRLECNVAQLRALAADE